MVQSGRAVVVHAPHHLELETRNTPDLGPEQVLVRVHTGGICGSDLHYYHEGGFGAVRIKAPMILGHELSGTVEAVGADVITIAPGARVAVNPSLPCGRCANCRRGIRNHCTDMRFFGSAMRWPHVDGGFRDHVVCHQSQAVPIADSVSFAEAALAEPLAVCLHALNRAGSIVGKRVLVTGSGPIGALTAAVARLGGAVEIVVTDILDQPLAMAKRLAADIVLNTRNQPDALAAHIEAHGHFDVHFEAAGSPAALLSGLAALGPRGVSVLIGLGAEIPLQVSSLMGREIEMRATFRFDTEFQLAIDYLESGRLDVKDLVTATLPVDRVVEAFDLASDKARANKVHLAFA
ncbi:MAG TPA: L-idonate 5-dehydrogenase [Devosia sp.]|nr:L-idonate 5-dehydrogenase [Devosia sp.]